MAGVYEYSTTASSNTSINSINIGEGCLPSTINNGLRQLMADVKGMVTVQSEASTHTIVAADLANLMRFTGAATANLTAAATLTANFWCVIKADGGEVTIDPDGSETVDGSATLVLPDGRWAVIWCDGSNFFSINNTLDNDLDDIAALVPADGAFIVGDGTDWTAETGATARASLGLTIGTDVQGVLAEGAFADGDKTKLDGIEDAADVTDAANVDAAGATMNTDTDVSSNSWVLDEDDLSSDSDTKVPTQQSVKSYVDNNQAGGPSVGTGAILRQNATNIIEDITVYDHATAFDASSTDTLNVGTDSGFANEDVVYVTTTGTLPTGLAIETKYYVVSAAASTMQLATTNGGSAISITHSSGSGTHTIHQAINAFSAGPITIESGHSVTVPYGSTWSII